MQRREKSSSSQSLKLSNGCPGFEVKEQGAVVPQHVNSSQAIRKAFLNPAL